jgi:hypothetical protein
MENDASGMARLDIVFTGSYDYLMLNVRPKNGFNIQQYRNKHQEYSFCQFEAWKKSLCDISSTLNVLFMVLYAFKFQSVEM